MRISDDRYSRDRARLDIAMHFIHHEARTHTIRQWTGLTDDRIRKLYRSYLQDGGRRVARHRGKSPQQPAFFLRTARVRHEAGALAALCCLVGAVERRLDRPGAAPLAGVARATALCQAYDVYRAIVGMPAIGFEHAVLLVNALARGSELALAECQRCGALVVADALALRPARCAVCADADPHAPQACSTVRRSRENLHR
jgi:hypothetical protein